MTRILVQRGNSGSSSSSNSNRSSTSVSTSSSPSATSNQPQATSNSQVLSGVKDDEYGVEAEEQVVLDELLLSAFDNKVEKTEDPAPGSLSSDSSMADEKNTTAEKTDSGDTVVSADGAKEVSRLNVLEEDTKVVAENSEQLPANSSCPPPPPIPPPKPLSVYSNLRRTPSGSSSSLRIGCSRAAGWPVIPARGSPTGSRPSSPRAHCESEGYNSADEQNTCYVSSYDDVERERQFEVDIRRVRGLEVRKMMEDGNCLFRAVADQVYGDSEAYDLVRQMCIDYMERERDHFSQFITEGFTSYCKRKRRDKVYGNNVEIQALCEMYNRPIHIYSYSTEPINIFHGSYDTDTPIRLSYHHGNHYNSLVDPRRQTVGAGLGFSCLRGANVDRDQVKAAIKAQQEQQIDNALLAEGRFYSDLELTEKEMERMVMEASRVEYLANNRYRQQLGHKESSTSDAEPSSSGARSTGELRQDSDHGSGLPDSVLTDTMQIMLSMGFSYHQVIEAYSIFGDDVDSMVCYLIETSSSSRRKGKATE